MTPLNTAAARGPSRVFVLDSAIACQAFAGGSSSPSALLVGGSVVVERAQQFAARVFDLVPVAVLNEQQTAGSEGIAFAIHAGRAAACHHEQPLVGATVPVVRVALGIAGRDHHFRRLRPRIAEGDAKSLAKSQMFTPHRCAPSHDRQQSPTPFTKT